MPTAAHAAEQHQTHLVGGTGAPHRAQVGLHQRRPYRQPVLGAVDHDHHEPAVPRQLEPGGGVVEDHPLAAAPLEQGVEQRLAAPVVAP